ncbi:MAG: hypothetical protein U9R43_17855 [Thermodesulfobacteriota bacterium]|nr:hypothetical protein [Thermodesulfobacteriota bacterium]
MSKSKKALIIISALAVLGIACVISYFFGFRYGIRSGGLISSMAEMMLADQHMSDQMANANCEGVRQAINDHLILLKKYRNVKGSFISETIYYGDKMLAHVRLSRIEKHMGNNEEALKHMERAREACANRKWEDCSEKKLIWFAKRLDEKNPIACLATKK